MLSFSLRRRSAPGSLNVREDSASPNRQQRLTPSVSSKKSLSSLFSLATKDSSPKNANLIEDNTLVEQDQYPLYDAADPYHNPDTTPGIRLKRTRRRSSSRNRAASGPRTLLDSLASKMRAATEFFHKSSEGDPQDGGGAASLPPPRSVSPKKSVRFRSGTYSPDETKSSPIAVPKKSAPTLPQLELPKAPFMNSFAPVNGDPIPTGRPPDTPVLKAKEKGDSYFPGLVKSGEFDNYQKSMQPLTPLRTKRLPNVDPPFGHPFEDSTAITRVHARRWSPCMSRSITAPTADSESSASKKLADPKGNTADSSRTSETLYEDQRPHVEQIEQSLDSLKVPVIADAAPLPVRGQKERQDADFAMDLQVQEEEKQRQRAADARRRSSGQGYQSKPHGPGRAPVGQEYQQPSAQVSWTVVHAQSGSAGDERHAEEGGAKRSVWTLASREQEEADGDGYASPSDDSDMRRSRSVSPRRSQRRQPTHEDIRRQFRSSRAQTPVASSERSPTSTDSVTECGAPFGTAMEAVSTTDPPKRLPQATPTTSTSEQEAIVPEHAVSPLNLRANVSATSPSRTRRPFRFSNSTDKDPHASPIGNTSFSWHAKKAEETPTPPASRTAQTPSPVSVPLPLSIPPKKRAYSTPTTPFRYANQYGWSPFDEDLFLDVFLSTPYLHPLLRKEGGFYVFWEQADLPLESAPTFDTEALTHEQVGDLVLQTHQGRIGGRGLNADTSDAMAKLFSPFVSSSVNKYGPLATHHEDYSGEVSTVDFPSAEASSETGPTFSSPQVSSEAEQHSLEGSCDMCLTRESYESSDGPSMPGSVSGYDSDVETTASAREEACLVEALTPSRLPRPLTNDKTPTQTDYARHSTTPLSQRAKKYYRSSETSNATASTGAAVSEDEKFASGIV